MTELILLSYINACISLFIFSKGSLPLQLCLGGKFLEVELLRQKECAFNIFIDLARLPSRKGMSVYDPTADVRMCLFPAPASVGHYLACARFSANLRETPGPWERAEAIGLSRCTPSAQGRRSELIEPHREGEQSGWASERLLITNGPGARL